jgi:hypothetical protein
MARAARIAGAILAQTRDALYLVGHPKVPCDWAAHGIDSPGEVDARERPFVRLRARAVELRPPMLELDVEGEALPQLLARCFLIERTGSISERLWRLTIGESDEHDRPVPEIIDARWLGQMPEPIWAVVREAVLRCS